MSLRCSTRIGTVPGREDRQGLFAQNELVLLPEPVPGGDGAGGGSGRGGDGTAASDASGAAGQLVLGRHGLGAAALPGCSAGADGAGAAAGVDGAGAGAGADGAGVDCVLGRGAGAGPFTMFDGGAGNGLVP